MPTTVTGGSHVGFLFLLMLSLFHIKLPYIQLFYTYILILVSIRISKFCYLDQIL